MKLPFINDKPIRLIELFGGIGVDQYCTRDIKCRTNMFYMCADDFCSYGERKDEE